MVAIANATTTVTVAKTSGEVMAWLRRAGARRIQTTYGDTGDDPTGVDFELVRDDGQSLVYQLPVNTEGVLGVLKRRDSGVPASKQTPAHAARVAWRIAGDWLRAQVALIEAGQATTEQVMLPYLIIGHDHEAGRAITVYDRYVQTGPPALTAGS